MSSSSASAALKQFLGVLEADAVQDLAPVFVGSLQALAAAPGLLGVVNAKLYLLGNGPQAVLQLEKDAVGAVITSVQADIVAFGKSTTSGAGSTGAAPSSAGAVGSAGAGK